MSLFHESWIMVVLGCLVAVQWQLGSCCSNEEKNSHLWQVGTSPPSYLFGTMHVPYNKLWKNIPENVKVAFASSQIVFLELDWTDEATNEAVSTCQLLPNNETVSKHLSARVLKRLKKYMNKLEVEIPRWHGESTKGKEMAKNLLGGWERKRPIWITLLLSSLNKQSVRSTASGTPLLDVFLGNAAHNMAKKLEAMEDANDQCNPFNKLSPQQAEYVLKKELDFLDEQGFEGGSDSTERNVNFYTCGDFEHMITSESLLPVPIHNARNRKQQELVRGIEEVLTTHMVLKRNRKMARRLLSTIKSSSAKTHFFAVGAGHLVGNNSVIDYLRRRGVSVVHLSSNTTIPGDRLPSNFELLGRKKIVPQEVDISTLLTTQPTHSTDDRTTQPFNISDILDQYGTTRPTHSMTLGPFFTLPTTTAPETPTTPTTTATISSSDGAELSNNDDGSQEDINVTSDPYTSKDDGSQEDINATSDPYTSKDDPLESAASTINHTTTTHLLRTLIISFITIIIYVRS